MMISDNHLVQIYENKNYLYSTITEFVHQGFEANEKSILICEAANATELKKRFNVNDLEKIIFIDAEEALFSIMNDSEQVEYDLFQQFVMSKIIQSNMQNQKIRFCSDIVNILARQERIDELVKLEEIWNQFLERNKNYTLLCAYHAANVGAASTLNKVCCSHASVVVNENFADSDSPALAQFSNGLAHELNNPLMVLMGTTKRLRKDVQTNDFDAALAKIDRIESNLSRMAKVVKGIQVFSKNESEA